jgi:hypothetical protein
MTRQAYSRQGDSGDSYIRFRAVYSPVIPTRTLSRVTPTTNIVNDVSWIKGSHTFQFGTNIRVIRNQRDSFTNAFDDATSNGFYYAPGSLVGPAGDVSAGTETPYVHGMAALLGRYPQYTGAYTYAGDGSLLPEGTPSAREFATEEYDFYVDDSWQVTSDFTLNLGLRYGYSVPVNETTGFQVQPQIPLGDLLDKRIAGAAAGTPVNDPILIDKSGPFYGKPGFYPADKNNFMPRVSFAWSPGFDGAMGKIFGSGGQSVIRGGFAVMYDRVGSQLAVTFDNSNTIGFNSSKNISANFYNVTDNLAPLFTGFNQSIRDLDHITPDPSVTFPDAKPADGALRIEGALDSTLTTPINYAWNFSMGRELGNGLFVEASYVGRAARNLLATRDIAHPNNLVDPDSGMDFYEAAGMLYGYMKNNVPVENVPSIPYWENLFPNLSWADTPTQGVYTFITREDLGGWDILDWTYLQDVLNSRGTIDPAFWHPSYGAFMAMSSIAKSDYHGFALTARQRFGDGLTWDFNYTLAKSLDNASGLQNSALTGSAALIRQPLDLETNHSVSDFDTRHIINTNWLYDIPVGKGRKFGSGMNSFADAVVGGWGFNGIFRWNSGRGIGFGPFESGRWGTNWQISNNVMRIRDPRPDPTKRGEEPNYWNDAQYAYNSLTDVPAGSTGDRNVYKRSSYVTFDFGLDQAFTMPYNEGHRLIFRWEVFNATNTQVLGPPTTNGLGQNPELNEMRPNFGIITAIQGIPRVMQLGLSFEF